MPVPRPPQQNLPRRYNVEWTRGGLVNSSPVGIHMATSQDIVGPPTAPILAGSDTVGFSGVMSGPLTVGSTQNLSIPVSFQALPQMTVPPGYSLVAQPSVNVTTSIGGLNIASSTLVVTALSQGFGQVSGPVFPEGSTYSGFGGIVILALTNSSGGTINPGTISGTAVLQIWIYNRDLAAKSNVQVPGGGGAPGSFSGSSPQWPGSQPPSGGHPSPPGGGGGPPRQ